MIGPEQQFCFLKFSFACMVSICRALGKDLTTDHKFVGLNLTTGVTGRKFQKANRKVFLWALNIHKTSSGQKKDEKAKTPLKIRNGSPKTQFTLSLIFKLSSGWHSQHL